MPTLEAFHVLSPVAAALEQLGWTPEDPATRDITPTVARGHNLIAVTPPAPVYATPALAGLLSRVGEGRRALVLCPPAQLDQWGVLVNRLTRDTGLRSQIAYGTARVMRLLRANAVEVVIASPETALALVTRSALRMDTVASLLIAWPESWPDEEIITPLMQDLPKDAQRIIYTAEATRTGAMVERYARKALTLGATPEASPAGPVRTASVPWSGRVRALADLVELLDPASLLIWTLDRSYHDTITLSVATEQPGIQVVAGGVVPASTIIAFDLPTPDQLRQLVTGGEVILLVPPGTEGYVARIAAPRRPVALPGLLDTVRAAEAAQRTAITQVIESGDLRSPLATLAPLFERHDPVAVAAALFQLWSTSSQPQPAGPPEPSATSRIYVGAGKKDGVTANDLVAVLTKELKVSREEIGRIELRDTFSLIEIPKAKAEQVATRLNGTTIRRRKVTARVDRGASRGPKRG